MVNLHQFPAKICYTASGILIVEDKILLIKHKKLGIWLPPGGHIEPDELAHQAAEREFWEETGLKVKAVSYGLVFDDPTSEPLPAPISVNLHWISQENYQARLHGQQKSAATLKNWGKGCEQHYNLQFLVEPISDLNFQQNVEETDGIAWFEENEIEDLESQSAVKTEIKNAFAIIKERKK